MKTNIALLALLALCLFSCATPATASDLYDNGPVNGQVNAWQINGGFSVTDSFYANGNVGAISFWAWLTPGDSVTSVQVDIDNVIFGSSLFTGVVSLTQSDCFGNALGLNVCRESGPLVGGPNLSGGPYWLTLSNAIASGPGDPVYWDENSGVGCTSPGCPSFANNNIINPSVGTIPSEPFEVCPSLPCGHRAPGTTTPEPGSIVLFASGVVALAAAVCRQLR